MYAILEGANDAGVNGWQRRRTEVSGQAPVVGALASLVALGAQNAVVGSHGRCSGWTYETEESASMAQASIG